MAAASWGLKPSGSLYTYLAGTATNSAQALYSGRATTRSPIYKKLKKLIYYPDNFFYTRERFQKYVRICGIDWILITFV